MTGVEILTTQEIAIKSVFNWTVFWISFGIVFSIVMISGLITFVTTSKRSDLCIATILGALLGFMISIGFGWQSSIPTEYQTQYKVTISDEVSMNEFLEKYEIINQEGKILTVRERSTEEDLQ